MTTFTCNTCLHIYQGFISNGKMGYMLRNRRIMLLTNEQECEDCVKILETTLADKKKEIQEGKIHGNTD